MNIESLNDEFSLDIHHNNLQIKIGKGNIPVVVVKNRHASAEISLQGAHLLSWIPNDEEEVIWLSDDATFKSGKSVRGGIPICWPWFGAHENNTAFPAHGFARTTNWQILSTEALEDGSTRISFITEPQAETEAMWSEDTSVQVKITVGKKLELELSTHNHGDESIIIGQALHTYFNVGDINKVLVHGLDNVAYLDKPDNYKRKVQHGPIVIDKEVDRVYLDTVNDCVIEDKTLSRNIVIKKSGSHSTVVWNPWKKVANNMGDLGKDGYTKMLCVESSNAVDDVVTVEAGQAHHLWVQYDVQNIS